MTTTATTGAVWAVRGRRRVRVTPCRAAGSGTSIAVTVSVGESGESGGAAPAADAHFSSRDTGATGEHAHAAIGAHAGVDDHFAVDADACTDERWLVCADVLHGGRPWPAGSAVAWARELLLRYPGCRLAGLPLIGGGWVVAERLGGCRLHPKVFRRSPRTHPERARAAWEYSLMASCLHGLVVTGHSLDELLPLTVLAFARHGAPPAR
ncbi:hypothetical protein [Streptomyces endophytica]|uniref:Uncharacterized protein n=1 Tax=Streptomyces endophytica TaxID=2991496 RepID=A0ABY6PAB4_9ACTN|nr:hypothetical protein [Streptomyces endophytica]UZJ30543.1 hypothetical protein OJ254_09485 [Streptomyces endophytica]